MLSSKKTAQQTQDQPQRGLVSVKSLTNIRCCSYVNPNPLPSGKTFEKYEVIIDSQKFEQELKLIEWRSKTEFPIVKILFYKILHKKMLNQCPVIQVAIENFTASLYTLPKMPLFQVFYLMKESIIGFERLYDRFGTFDISNKMVLINKNLKCRVWMNENITLNFPSKKLKINQYQFKNQILNLFEEKCIKSTLSMQFFKGAFAIRSMLEVIQFIENFTKSNKIILANKFNSIYQSLGNKKADDNGGLCQAKFETSSMKKIPKFIQDMRALRRIQKDLNSKSFDSPSRKIDEILARDLSHNKLKKQEMKQSDVESTSKSILTPKSFVSVDAKQDYRSNNEEISLNHKKISKKQSHENFNLSIISKDDKIQPLKTEKHQEKNEEERRKNFFNQHHRFQLSKANKFRKLSNGQNESKKIENITSAKNIHFKQPTSPQIEKIGRRKGEISLKNILDNVPRINILAPLQEQSTKDDVFSKNGWLKRFNSLTAEQFRQTIHSHFDGNDVLSDELRLSDFNLDILGAMGKQLRGSILIQHER